MPVESSISICSAYALMTFLPPRQLGDMDDSDDEMQLINDVDSLDSQLNLKEADYPCDETRFVHLSQDLNAKPLAKRS
jgi:hypothetical protein